jgi:predicted RNA binding protein YcfA (HicA-like mRNA interferase family)
MNAKEIVKKLMKNGFYKKSQNGTSHLKMTNGTLFTVIPMHGKDDFGIGLIKAIEQQTQVKLR